MNFLGEKYHGLYFWMTLDMVSDLGLQDLPFIQQFSDTPTMSKMDLFKF